MEIVTIHTGIQICDTDIKTEFFITIIDDLRNIVYTLICLCVYFTD